MTWRVGIRVIAVLFGIWPTAVASALIYAIIRTPPTGDDVWVTVGVFSGAAALLFVMFSLSVGLWNYAESARMAATVTALIAAVLFGWVLWDRHTLPDDLPAMLFFTGFAAMFLFLRSDPVKQVCNELIILRNVR
jgi:hypothetical protein